MKFIILFCLTYSFCYGQNNSSFSDFVVEKNFSNKQIDRSYVFAEALRYQDYSEKKIEYSAAEFIFHNPNGLVNIEVLKEKRNRNRNGNKKKISPAKVILALGILTLSTVALVKVL